MLDRACVGLGAPVRKAVPGETPKVVVEQRSDGGAAGAVAFPDQALRDAGDGRGARDRLVVLGGRDGVDVPMEAFGSVQRRDLSRQGNRRATKRRKVRRLTSRLRGVCLRVRA